MLHGDLANTLTCTTYVKYTYIHALYTKIILLAFVSVLDFMMLNGQR